LAVTKEQLRNQVMDYVSSLGENDSENAWHALVELSTEALPYIREAYHLADDNKKRELLIQVLAEQRDEESLALFSELLYDPAPEIWKAALDALVSIGGSTAADLLRKAEANVTAERCDWVREALQQFV
jgi:HEAT repeat protein